jgi:ribosomal protein S18 acetylase RimI-like enzyme
MTYEELYMVRLCKPEDAEEDAAIIAPLIRELVQAHNVPNPPEIPPLVDLVYSLISTGFSEFLVAEVQHEPVGCLQVNYRLSTWAAAPYAAIEDIYVRPDVQEPGIQESMIDYACQRIESRGCAYVEIEVHPDHEEAAKAYKRMGFQPFTTQRMKSSLPRKKRCPRCSHTGEAENVS